jgi:hypothetical protein
MKASILFLTLCATAHCAPPDAFWRALHLVETGGRRGAILGDNGKALGPLQIHRAYWQDARVGGRYEDCADFDYSKRVAAAYLRRYAPEAWDKGDIFTLARIHNGGLNGARKPATIPYAQKVLRNIK